jgi:hypothetical protein
MCERELILCFANIHFLCIFLRSLMCQNLCGVHKSSLLCIGNTEDSLYSKSYFPKFSSSFFLPLSLPKFSSHVFYYCFSHIFSFFFFQNFLILFLFHISFFPKFSSIVSLFTSLFSQKLKNKIFKKKTITIKN